MSGPARPDGSGARFFGVYPAIVVDHVDPQELGRIQVRFPWLGEAVTAWATLCSPYAEDGQGLQMLPSVDSQVVVAFEAGDPRRPYIVGAVWNGAEPQPETPRASNDLRVLHTRSGHRLEFDDAEGSTKITLRSAGGHTVTLDDGSTEIEIAHSAGSTIRITASGAIELTANANVDVSASVVNVRAPVANFDGIVNCQTLIASSAVVSPSYTPGAGNIW